MRLSNADQELTTIKTSNSGVGDGAAGDDAARERVELEARLRALTEALIEKQNKIGLLA
jgi:hypothetical protein